LPSEGQLVYRRLLGVLFFFATAVFLLGLSIAGFLFPGYSDSANYVSDLGVGPTAWIFNSAILVTGVLTILAAVLIIRKMNRISIGVTLFLAGVGAIGVGVFPETFPILHYLAASVAFIFYGISAVISSRITRPPVRYFSVGLGLISLTATALFRSQSYFGLGPGGMERMIVYPVLIWGLILGGYFSADISKVV
jgi:hypothetical membrane protein